jgi:hypothetical protein
MLLQTADRNSLLFGQVEESQTTAGRGSKTVSIMIRKPTYTGKRRIAEEYPSMLEINFKRLIKQKRSQKG